MLVCMVAKGAFVLVKFTRGRVEGIRERYCCDQLLSTVLLLLGCSALANGMA